MSASASSYRFDEPGPFRADQIREGDRYELSDGHPIYCAPGGYSHGEGNLEGARVLRSDPEVKSAGVDVGIACNEGKNLRAPDVIVTEEEAEPGWFKGVPKLALEYADRGQNEAELRQKVGELLELGVPYIWVVRLTGPLRVEVHRRGQPMQTVPGDGTLEAPGVLRNPVPVRALVDAAAAEVAVLRNLLNRRGYAGLEEVEARNRAAGKAEMVLTVLAARGIAVPEETRAHLLACRDEAQLTRWVQRAAVAANLDEVVTEP